MKQVKEIMTNSPQTCEKNESIHSVATKMSKSNLGSLPVVDANRKVIGMLTDRDVCLAISKRNKPAHEIQVHEAMTNTVHTIDSEEDVTKALQIMRTKKVGRLPVVDKDKRIKGIVSLNGIVRKIQGSSNETEIEHSGKENVLNTLQAIAERNEHYEDVEEFGE